MGSQKCLTLISDLVSKQQQQFYLLMMDTWLCFEYFTLLIFLYMFLLISYCPHFINENKTSSIT